MFSIILSLFVDCLIAAVAMGCNSVTSNLSATVLKLLNVLVNTSIPSLFIAKSFVKYWLSLAGVLMFNNSFRPVFIKFENN